MNTGRFEYGLWEKDAKESRKALAEAYDRFVDVAECEHDKATDNHQKASLSIVVDESWDTIDAISEAIKALDEGRQAVVYHLFRELIGDAHRIIRAARRSSNGGVTASVDGAIDAALDAELARCPPEGPVDLGRVADELQQEGISRGWRSLVRRLKARGVVLPTTSKRQVSRVGRQRNENDIMS